MSPKIEDVMVKNVVTVEPKVTVKGAAERKKEQVIGCLVAVDGTKSVGIVTERDRRVVIKLKNP